MWMLPIAESFVKTIHGLQKTSYSVEHQNNTVLKNNAFDKTWSSSQADPNILLALI